MFVRALKGLMFLFFLTAVALQHNDPDPYLWMPIYGLAALWSGLVLFRKELPRLVVLVFSLLCLLGAAYLGVAGPSQTASPIAENYSEFGGLLTTAVWGMLLLKMSRTRV